MKAIKTIVFISLNRHQWKYFQALGQSLRNDYKVLYVYYPLSAIMNFMGGQSPFTQNFTQSEINEIIAFEHTKGKYRNFGPIRRLLHSKTFLEKKAHSAINYFYRYIIQNNVDLVCVWNGTLTPLAVAASVAQKLGKKTLFFENGYLPNTTTVDPVGVNNRNSLVSKTSSFYDKVIINEQKLAKIYQRPIGIRELKAKWYHRLINCKPHGTTEEVELPYRYIFLPLQVHDDTQVLLHSPRFKTMRELIDYVVPAVQCYNERTGDDLWIVIKEHPSDFGRVDYTDLKDKYQAERVLFLRYYPTPKLIEKAKGIITLNSSVGLEGLVHHKPVITLGNAFYNIPGIVTDVGIEENLCNWIHIIDQSVNDELIDKFLYYLRYHYLVAGSWRIPDKEHFTGVRGKIASQFAE